VWSELKVDETGGLLLIRVPVRLLNAVHPHAVHLQRHGREDRVVASVEPIFQSACSDHDALLAFGPLFMFAATLVQEILEYAQLDPRGINASVPVPECNVIFIHLRKVLESFTTWPFVHHYACFFVSDLLPPNQRVRVHVRAVVLEDFATAVFDRCMADSATVLVPPSLSTEIHTLLDEDSPAAVACEGHTRNVLNASQGETAGRALGNTRAHLSQTPPLNQQIFDLGCFV
jgi:hypothetical protein